MMGAISNPVYEFVFSFLGALFFARLFKAPLKTIPASAAVGGVGWLCYRYLGEGLLAFFIASMVIAACGEILARLYKKPATIFIHTAVIPLVPGLGLYRTMLHLVEEQYIAGLMQGVNTLLGMGCIAMAVGVVSLLFKYVRPKPVRRARG